MRGPLRLIWTAAFVLVLALVTVPLLELAGLRPRTGVRLRTLADWAFGHGLRVVLISVLAYALIRTITLLIRRFEHEINLGTGLDALERAKRAKTLGSVVRNFATALVTAVADPDDPARAGPRHRAGPRQRRHRRSRGRLRRADAGARHHQRILPDPRGPGSASETSRRSTGSGGLVEAINLRTIVLRDAEGTVHVFPNGAITTLANRSKDFSFYVIDLGDRVPRGSRPGHGGAARDRSADCRPTSDSGR